MGKWESCPSEPRPGFPYKFCLPRPDCRLPGMLARLMPPESAVGAIAHAPAVFPRCRVLPDQHRVVSLAPKYGAPARTAQAAIENLRWKVGIVVVVLGVVHFFNILVFSKWRNRATERAVNHEEYRNRFNRVRDVVPAD